MDGLTPKRAAFCREYLKDLNGTQAYLRAFYPGDRNPSAVRLKTAAVESSKLLRNPKVAAAIQAAMDARAKRTELSADYVLRNLQEVTERCMQRAPVMAKGEDGWQQEVDEEGRHVWEFNANGANKALELLGKHLKLFTDKVEHSFGEMTDEQLEARKAEILAKAQSATRPPQ